MQAIEIIPSRLYYASMTSMQAQAVGPNIEMFSIDKLLVYDPYYYDFGPLNLGQLYQFCQILNSKLDNPDNAGKQVYCFCSQEPDKRANLAFLLCSWQIIYQNKTR